VAVGVAHGRGFTQRGTKKRIGLVRFCEVSNKPHTQVSLELSPLCEVCEVCEVLDKKNKFGVEID
jgi:hypothetical protein